MVIISPTKQSPQALNLTYDATLESLCLVITHAMYEGTIYCTGFLVSGADLEGGKLER